MSLAPAEEPWVRVTGRRVSEVWVSFDALGLLLQLGKTL